MKVIGTIIIVFSTLCSYAQHQILNTEWIVKRVSVDTLLLSAKSDDEVAKYLERPCEFQDTAYYWTLSQNGAIKINQVIRSCSTGWQKSSAQKQDSSKISPAVLTHYETSNLNPPKEFRASLWDKSEGKFFLKKKRITISATEKFDGNYRIEILDSRLLRLISTNK